MKGLFLLLAMLACSANVLWAQDTIRFGDTNSRYIFPPLVPYDTSIDLFYFSYSEGQSSRIWSHSGNFLQEFTSYMGYIVDEPTIIYGIAAAVSSFHPPFVFCLGNASQYTQYSIGLFDFEAYAMLVQKEGDQYYHADSARWHNQLPNRYVVFPQSDLYVPDIGDTTVSTYEFYFPEPCVVQDTFGVGIWFTYIEAIDSIATQMAFVSGYFGGTNTKSQFRIDEYLNIEEGICSRGYSLTPEYERMICLFPIIAPPDTDSFGCPRVENFRLIGQYRDGIPTFDWDTQVGQSQFQVAYGPADGDPDSYTVLTATSQPYLLSAQDLDPTVVYAARCRGGCQHICPLHDTVSWSEWSDTVHFCTSALDIVPVEGGLAFTLSPNPARESVTVTVGEGIALPCTVGLRDEAGHELLRQRMEGRETTLSTKGLPAGLYLVTLDTQKGSSTQKLVVER